MEMKETLCELKNLSDQFGNNIKQYKSDMYDEANTRVDFIDKLFILLGWDVTNNQGYSESYRDVVREDKIQIEGKQKAPDYSFRIGGVRKFFVEAKKPSVNIKDDISPAFQVRRYGYTAKVPLSILTDFEEFAVYDTRIKPDKNDKASVGRVFYCTFEEYEKHFDFIYNTFSKNAILKGSFDNYIEENKNKKGTGEVDKELLKLVEDWRTELAKNIALRNNEIDIYNLNNAVQKIIDRIIFLRIAEDKEIEPYEQLLKITKTGDIENKGLQPLVYQSLNELFVNANKKYNAGLFKPESWLTDIKIDDKALIYIIKGLYYPECPYEFSILPIEILGNIYEQFLGKTIRFKNVKEGHTAIIEEKPEVRKAGGVYYTPQYIVNYIVENTIGEKIKDKTPDEIAGNNGLKPVAILDPACGSGSFLVGAYQYLLNYHIDYWSNEKNIKKALKEGKIYQVSENNYKLTIEEKQKILINNIHGVDIDPQAVEVTKLSLYLKLLENEGKEAEGFLFKHSDIKLLPTLDKNIKCGNSLIGSDFYKDKDLTLFGNEEMRKVNVFDWDKEFPEIFGGKGKQTTENTKNTEGGEKESLTRSVGGAEEERRGFDVVIGNPPYFSLSTLELNEQNYYKNKYKVFDKTGDIYCLFFELSIKLLKHKGIVGLITSNQWLQTNYGKILKNYFIESSNPKLLINFGGFKVFQDATVDTSIFIIVKEKCDNKLTACHLKKDFVRLSELNDYLEKNKIVLQELNADKWIIADDGVLKLKHKIKSTGLELKNHNINIYRGILTGYNEAFIINKELKELLCKEDSKNEEIIRPILRGRDVHRYFIEYANLWIIFTRRGINIKDYPTIEMYLKQFKNRLNPGTGRKSGSYQWYEIQDNTAYFDKFNNEKLIYPETTVRRGEFYLDKNNYFIDKTCFMIVGENLKYLNAILSSKLMEWYLETELRLLGKNSIQYSKQFIENIPIPNSASSASPRETSLHDQLVSLVDQMLESQKLSHNAKSESDKKIYAQKIEMIDNQIDRLVYELYGLTEEEIEIVEEKK